MRTISLEELRRALDDRGLLSSYAWHRDQFMARCPCHDDRIASLSIGYSEGVGALVRCHSGCTDTEGHRPILQALGLWDDSLQRNGHYRSGESLQRTQRTQSFNGASLHTPRPTSVGTTSVGVTSVRVTSVGSTSVGSTSVGDDPRALAVMRGRAPTITRTEVQRWQDLLLWWQGLVVPVAVEIEVPTHAGPALQWLAGSLELYLGLRAARGGLPTWEPFTFTRSNPKRGEDEPCGFGEAWALLTSNQVAGGLHTLQRFGSIEKVPPPPGTALELLEGKHRGHRTAPNWWQLAEPW